MLKDILLKARSIRSFNKNRSVSEDELYDIIDATRLCPSSANLQVLKFRPVYTPGECDKVFPLTKWAGYLKDMQIPPIGHEPTGYVVICFDSLVTNNTSAFQTDVGICGEAIILRAAEMGLGGCMIGSFDREKIKEALSLPDNLIPALVIALGEADETPVIVDSDGDIKYYRENGVHYVPKRTLSEIVVK